MTGRRNVMIAGSVVFVAVVAIALATSRSADAGRPFGLWSLDGEYHFSVSEIRVETSPVPMTVYCNVHGVIEFDGAGSAEILATRGFGWCRDGDGNDLLDDPVEPGCFDYEVFADGSVVITELTDPPACSDRPVGERYTTHCQILDKGRLLICDGTGDDGTAGGGDIPDDRLLWTATAGRL